MLMTWSLRNAHTLHTPPSSPLINTKNVSRTLIDASVLHWGQIKTRIIPISLLHLPPSSVKKTALTRNLLLFTFAPQRQYKMCVNIGPCNVPAQYSEEYLVIPSPFRNLLDLQLGASLGEDSYLHSSDVSKCLCVCVCERVCVCVCVYARVCMCVCVGLVGFRADITKFE